MLKMLKTDYLQLWFLNFKSDLHISTAENIKEIIRFWHLSNWKNDNIFHIIDHRCESGMIPSLHEGSIEITLTVPLI